MTVIYDEDGYRVMIEHYGVQFISELLTKEQVYGFLEKEQQSA